MPKAIDHEGFVFKEDYLYTIIIDGGFYFKKKTFMTVIVSSWWISLKKDCLFKAFVDK